MPFGFRFLLSSFVISLVSACGGDGVYVAQQVAEPVIYARAVVSGGRFEVAIGYRNAQPKIVSGDVESGWLSSIVLKPSDPGSLPPLTLIYDPLTKLWSCDGCNEAPGFPDVGRIWKKVD